MAKIVVKIVGGNPKNADYATLGDLLEDRDLDGYSANINGESESDEDFSFSDDDFVILSPKAKGNK